MLDVPHPISTRAKCKARTSKGLLCPNFARKNRRCRLHGGLSTGPRTEEGKLRAQGSRLIHGMYTLNSKKEKQTIQNLIRELNALSSQL